MGYLLLRKFLDDKENKDMKKQRIRTEQSFSRAVTHALKPQGLRLTAKRASLQELTDEEVVMSALDDLARERVVRTKRASFLGKLAWWAALGLVPAAGIGASMGWRYGAAGNPYTKELKDIKRRSLLQAINAPASPILTTANIDNLRAADSQTVEEEEEDELR